MNRTSQILISCNTESFVLHSWDCRDVPTLGGPDLTVTKRKKSATNLFSRCKDQISISKLTGCWKQYINRATMS